MSYENEFLKISSGEAFNKGIQFENSVICN
jgi:hypothetical protein